jgi:hypothetical protein
MRERVWRRGREGVRMLRSVAEMERARERVRRRWGYIVGGSNEWWKWESSDGTETKRVKVLNLFGGNILLIVMRRGGWYLSFG